MEKKWTLVYIMDRYYFKDERGIFSESYAWAGNYFNGFAIVQKEDGAPYQFRDVNGNLSEGFYSIDNYHNGLAKVQKNFGYDYQYRDIYGNLYNSINEARAALNNMQLAQNQKETTKQSTSTQGKNNKNIDGYFKNEVTVYDLSPKDIYDNLEKIVDWEKYNCKLEMENADEEMREEIFKIYSTAAGYIKHTAYEYSEELKNKKSIEEFIGKLF